MQRPTTSPDDADTVRRLHEQAEVLRASEAFGRSQALERLFQFLLACSLEGRSPKELEIADEVFGRTAQSIDQDASIRVHIHRLRRKLSEFYAGPGASEPVRLTIPKGGYRLVVEAMPAEIPSADEPPEAAPAPWNRRAVEIAAVLLLLILTAATSWWLARRSEPADAALQAARSSALWRPALGNGRRLAIVVGDYYIFGERDAEGDIARLVREFNVNSPRDLELLIASGSRRASGYVDLGLEYLPVGVGNALRSVVPLLRHNDRDSVPSFVVPASQLTPELVKLTNIVYLGYLSGLGSLRDPMFSASRFAVGGTYDEIVDRRTGKHYMAGSHLDQSDANPTLDYALISSFPGVTGNQIIVIAGTRDAALMQAAEFATRPDSLADISRRLNGQESFDALLSIESLRNVGLRARLLDVSPRRGDTDWSGKRTQFFPDDLESAPLPPARGTEAR